MTLAPMGDSAVVVTFGAAVDDITLLRVRALTAALSREKSPVIVDIVPAYTSVTVFYEIAPAGALPEPPYERICRIVKACLAQIEDRWPDLLRENLEGAQSSAELVVEIPVCYGGAFGPDLEDVARHCAMSADEVVQLHSSGTYNVHAIGFTPGFPYLGGLPQSLHTPRRTTPRISVEAGSVGIGGTQTGIYPLKSPGGWQLIGRTPRRLFDIRQDPPSLLRVGDRVKFVRMAEQDFASWK